MSMTAREREIFHMQPDELRAQLTRAEQRIAAMKQIISDQSATHLTDTTRIAQLEGENAALREVVAPVTC